MTALSASFELSIAPFLIFALVTAAFLIFAVVTAFRLQLLGADRLLAELFGGDRGAAGKEHEDRQGRHHVGVAEVACGSSSSTRLLVSLISATWCSITSIAAPDDVDAAARFCIPPASRYRGEGVLAVGWLQGSNLLKGSRLCRGKWSVTHPASNCVAAEFVFVDEIAEEIFGVERRRVR